MTDAQSWKIGDEVEVQTAQGDWLRAKALSLPRYDVQNAVKRRHPTLTVSVHVATMARPVNWPAEYVRVAAGVSVLSQDAEET